MQYALWQRHTFYCIVHTEYANHFGELNLVPGGERKMCIDKGANLKGGPTCNPGGRNSKTPCTCVRGPIGTAVSGPSKVLPPPSPEDMDGDILASFAGARE